MKIEIRAGEAERITIKTLKRSMNFLKDPPEWAKEADDDKLIEAMKLVIGYYQA
jgi:hypothetical protein